MAFLLYAPYFIHEYTAMVVIIAWIPLILIGGHLFKVVSMNILRPQFKILADDYRRQHPTPPAPKNDVAA